MLAQFGAVSEQVAAAMAEGARDALHADYALSITGVAGPDGGTPEKPVGLVYLGCAGPAGHARAQGLVPRRPRHRASVQRHVGAAPAPHGALIVSGEARTAGSGPERLRLFVACDLPPEVERAVRRGSARELSRRDDLRVTPTLHLTLAFLGSVDDDRVADLERVLAGVTWQRADCRFKQPLFLPAHGKRRVVALELDDPSGTLRRLQAEVSAGLSSEGLYEPEKRPWLPHVTVARFRRPGHPFSLQNVNIGAFGVVRMVLYSSHLKRAVQCTPRWQTSPRPEQERSATLDKDKALEAAVTQIERQFGKGSVMRIGDHPVSDDMQTVPTGSLALDIALGVGGIPRGRIVEIYGPESSGKTTMVYHLIAQAQKRGGQAAFIDAEHAMDPIYAKAIGVDVDNLLVSQPDYGEQALEIAEMLVRSGALDIVAIDSVAALTPKAEIEGEMGDSFVGLQARLMSQALRKLHGTLSRSGTICVFTNQLREKIGVMFGNPEVTTGGKALKFYATIRLDIRRIETLKDGTEAVGNRVPRQGRQEQGRTAVQAGRVRHHVRPGHLARRNAARPRRAYDVVAKSGAFFSYNDERLGQGRANAKVFLKENPDIADAIEVQIRAKAGLPGSAAWRTPRQRSRPCRRVPSPRASTPSPARS